ncbi:MAG: hypothetical protein AB7F19_02950 [Candidatus Babeliales bacterium]
MQRSIYYIFLLSFGSLVAMEGDLSEGEKLAALAQELHERVVALVQAHADCAKSGAGTSRLITVVNILKQPVFAHIDTAQEHSGQERKVYIPCTNKGIIAVLPPQFPAVTHMLLIKDVHDSQTLAQNCFAHPKEDTTFVVKHDNSVITVAPITRESLPDVGPQEAGSKEFAALLVSFEPPPTNLARLLSLEGVDSSSGESITRGSSPSSDEQPCADSSN